MDTAQPDRQPPHFLRQVFRPRMANQEAAEAIALTALAHVLEDTDRAGRFCTATGLGGAELAGYVRDPVFLGGVLDFVLDDEALLVEVAAAAQVSPETLAAARRRLPGAPVRE
ncbi:MAG TPA: DUF3572 family protein [Alphaproteobacteria bacterium]